MTNLDRTEECFQTFKHQTENLNKLKNQPKTDISNHKETFARMWSFFLGPLVFTSLIPVYLTINDSTPESVHQVVQRVVDGRVFRMGSKIRKLERLQYTAVKLVLILVNSRNILRKATFRPLLELSWIKDSFVKFIRFLFKFLPENLPMQRKRNVHQSIHINRIVFPEFGLL